MICPLKENTNLYKYKKWNGRVPTKKRKNVVSDKNFLFIMKSFKNYIQWLVASTLKCTMPCLRFWVVQNSCTPVGQDSNICVGYSSYPVPVFYFQKVHTVFMRDVDRNPVHTVINQ